MVEQNDRTELTYNQLLLQHLSRISTLSVFVPSSSNIQGIGFNNLGEKIDSYGMAVNIFRAFIPRSMEDEDYKKEVKEFEENLIKEYGGENTQLGERRALEFEKKLQTGRLRRMIELLARKGLLFETTGIARLPIKKKKEDSEEWEN